jgi:predicted  nucleic acid-binding Zn-ribbon protein
VPQFIAAINSERARLEAKCAALLSNQEYAALAHEIHDAQHQVNQIADGEIARAKASGTVEFDSLPNAMRATARGLSDVVSKINGRK